MGCGHGFIVMVEESCYLTDYNNAHGYYDDEEFDITGVCQRNMNKKLTYFLK